MPEQIEPEILRAWLEAKHPVTVLDVRSEGDRAQWSIPGSIHVNAYDALRAGNTGPLHALDLPRDRPVVTVCSAGRTSQIAAEVLAGRGFDARSLRGGMKGWSLAWNLADVPLGDPSVQVVQVRRTGKGCLSYLIGSAGEAAVIDPSLSAGVYGKVAARNGWRIRYVLETHIHADHLSRARQLADETGAELFLPDQARASFRFTPLRDGDRIAFGAAALAAQRTPGHTDESTCYVLNGRAAFTGDTLFIRSVGRPDLHGDPETTRARSRALFASLARIAALPREIVVLPAHANDPVAFDGRAVCAPLAEIATWLSAWLTSESAFVERVSSNLPSTPANFARIAALNAAGEVPAEDPADLESGPNLCAVG